MSCDCRRGASSTTKPRDGTTRERRDNTTTHRSISSSSSAPNHPRIGGAGEDGADADRSRSVRPSSFAAEDAPAAAVAESLSASADENTQSVMEKQNGDNDNSSPTAPCNITLRCAGRARRSRDERRAMDVASPPAASSPPITTTVRPSTTRLPETHSASSVSLLSLARTKRRSPSSSLSIALCPSSAHTKILFHE